MVNNQQNSINDALTNAQQMQSLDAQPDENRSSHTSLSHASPSNKTSICVITCLFLFGTMHFSSYSFSEVFLDFLVKYVSERFSLTRACQNPRSLPLLKLKNQYKNR